MSPSLTDWASEGPDYLVFTTAFTTNWHMADRLTRQQRHNNMAAIKGRDTRPEWIVRRFLFSRGFRYRLCHPRLPGHPDIVMRKYRTCIFVNGCFWHGHVGCPYFRMPKTNIDFWREKIERNRLRDKTDQKSLSKMGWHCITVWECELRPARRTATLTALEYTLNTIFLSDRTKTYTLPDLDEMGMVAEERTDEHSSEKV